MKKLFFVFALLPLPVSLHSLTTLLSQSHHSQSYHSQSHHSQSHQSPLRLLIAQMQALFKNVPICFAAETQLAPQLMTALQSLLATVEQSVRQIVQTSVQTLSNPDPSLITQECGTCVSSVGSDRNSQCAADFSAACGADQNCIAFATDLQGCPQN